MNTVSIRHRVVGLLVAAACVGSALAVEMPAATALPSSGIDLCAQVGQKAGFKSSSLVTAVAIAMAESSCTPNATNNNTNGTTDRGLWQINSIHTQYTVSCTFDPQCNADAAWDISSHGSNWEPWTTYNTGAYENYLDQARAAVARLSPTPSAPADPGGEFSDVDGNGHGDLLDMVPDGTLRDFAGSGNLAHPFAAATEYRAGTGFDTYHQLVSGDITGDGNADLLAARSNGDLTMYVSQGDIQHPYLSTKSYPVGAGFDEYAALFLADLNRDGKADLVAEKPNGDVFVYRSAGGEHPFTSSAMYKIGSGFDVYRSLGFADLNNDGNADLVAEKPNGDLFVYKGLGSVTNAFDAPAVNVGSGFDEYSRIRVGDIDGDGRAELLGQKPNGDLWLYKGLGSLTHPFSSASGDLTKVGTGFDTFTQLT